MIDYYNYGIIGVDTLYQLRLQYIMERSMCQRNCGVQFFVGPWC